MKTLTPLCIASILASLAGCDSRPSEADAASVLRERVGSQSDGRMRVVSVRKTNGREMKTPFGEVYEVDYQAELEFTEDCAWSPRWPLGGEYETVAASVKADLDRLRDPEARSKMPPKEYWRLFTLSNSPDYNRPLELAHKGQRFTRNGKLLFVKTEKGWRAERNSE